MKVVIRPHLTTDRVIAAVAAAIMGIFGFLPNSVWSLLGQRTPQNSESEWLAGGTICLGLGVVLAIASRRFPDLWRTECATRIARAAFVRPAFAASLLAGGAFFLYLIICVGVFDTRPLLIDEIVQVYQARVFATGHLTAPVAVHSEFFGNLHMVEHAGRLFAQFPPGYSFLLSLGEIAHVRWMITPLCGGVAVLLFARLVRALEPRPTVAVGAAVLFALCPFMAFMAGSHMNHVPTIAFLMGALVALERVVRCDSPKPWAALTVGLCFGAAAAIRPVDALAFAAPAAAWLVTRAFRTPTSWWNVVAAGIGVMLPMTLVLWVNAETTGAPFLFGYELLWGRSHNLGFHETPWGPAHTPARGALLVRLYFIRLQHYLFETPLPSLLPAGIALSLARQVCVFDRYLLASSGCVVALYFGYWHDGFYLGPRFMLPLVPVLAIWSARSLSSIAETVGRGAFVHRTAVYTTTVALVIGCATEVPLRVRQYRNGLLTMRWDADAAASRANVRHALVLVRESWGAERIARMWSLGLTRPEAEHMFAHTDACKSQQVLDSLDHARVVGRSAYFALSQLLVDSARVVRTELPSGSKEPMLPGATYNRLCLERINDDVNGFTVHLPLMLARWGGNVYARDLHARDTLLLKDFPGRPIWILRPTSSRLGAPPEFTRPSRDSLSTAWYGQQ